MSHTGRMEALITTALVVLIFSVLVISLVRFQRGLDQPGGRDGLGSIGDAFGNMIEVLDPGTDRAKRDLRAEEHKGPVTPSPDPDLDRPVYIETGSDGRPTAVRIRRQFDPPEGTGPS
jgi:hypothetical protein